MNKAQREIFVNAELDAQGCEIATDWAAWGLKYGRDLLAIIRDLDAERLRAAAMREKLEWKVQFQFCANERDNWTDTDWIADRQRREAE